MAGCGGRHARSSADRLCDPRILKVKFDQQLNRVIQCLVNADVAGSPCQCIERSLFLGVLSGVFQKPFSVRFGLGTLFQDGPSLGWSFRGSHLGEQLIVRSEILKQNLFIAIGRFSFGRWSVVAKKQAQRNRRCRRRPLFLRIPCCAVCRHCLLRGTDLSCQQLE